MINYFGAMFIASGFSVLLPLLTLFFYKSEVFLFSNYVLPGVCAICLGYLLINLRVSKKNHNDTQTSSVNLKGQSAFVVLCGWIIAICVNAMPFILSKNYSVAQSFFECISGFTTTGLSIVDVDNAPKIVLMHRSIMLYFGGIGIVLSVLFFLKDNGALRLYSMEGHSDMLSFNVASSSRSIVLIYTLYILIGVVLYKIFGMSFFDAINHSIAAVSTGGFSTHSQSIGFFNSDAINYVTIFLMIAGSTNFLIHLLVFTGKFKRFISYSETKVFLILLVIFVPLISYFFYVGEIGPAGKSSFSLALFQTVSALTTTGFQTIDSFTTINSGAFLCILFLMLIGGGSGSTAGGIKQYRFYIAIKDLFWTVQESFGFKRNIYPHHVQRQNTLSTADISHRKETLSFIILYMLLFSVATFVISFTGEPLSHIMFEVASSLGTVGLSTGVACATSPAYVLWTCSVCMLLGRLEIYVFIFGVIYAIKKLS